MSEEIILESKETDCLLCGSKISKHTRSSKILVYSANGPKIGKSVDKRCSNQSCKAGYFLGYYTPHESDLKFYTANAIKEDFIISTCDTAFATIVLYDGVLSMKCGHNAFTTQAKMYNLKHQYHLSQPQFKRSKLSDKCLARGIWRYALLDLERRYNIGIQHYHDLDRTLETNMDKIHAKIEQVWTQHRCSQPGCGTILVCDGGMKPRRRYEHLVNYFLSAFCGKNG